MWIMGVDMGTSGCKAVVFDENWIVKANAYCEYPMCFPENGLLELDSELVWDGIREVIRRVNQKIEQPVEALAVSAIGDVIIPIGMQGIQVRNSIVDFDPRGAAELEQFVKKFGIQRFFQLSGMPPLYIGSLAKILWLKKHEPHNYKKVDRWATYEDFIVSKLGISPAVSYGEAARTMLFDIRKKQWCKEILAAAAISPERLPRVVPSATKLGIIPEEIARELGFSKPVVVVSGGHDMVCAAVGAGLDERKPENAVDIAGTIEGVVATFKEPNTTDKMLENALPCYPSYNGYVTFSVNLTAGCIVRWYRDNLALDMYEYCKDNNLNIYEYMQCKVDADIPGKLLFIPHFSGSGTPYFDSDAYGAIYGLNLNTSREDIARAMIEGLAHEVKLHIKALHKAKIDIQALICVGGGNTVDKQLQLKSNITGLKVIKGEVSESSAFGAAAYAATAVGQIEDPADAYLSLNNQRKEYTPTTVRAFKERQKQYEKLSEIIHEFDIDVKEV